LNHSVAIAFVLASISCAILALQALCKETNVKAGIATVQVKSLLLLLACCKFVRFNLTGAIPNIHLGQKRDLIQSLGTGAESVANGIVTAAPSVISQVATMGPSVISQVQSAADTLATTLPSAVKTLIPPNCLINIK
ncbi:hypothetical protein K432DRAFT_313477, partial [Lepidopterella palustris CBS 459.81]